MKKHHLQLVDKSIDCVLQARKRIYELRKSWLELRKELFGLTILLPKLSSKRQAFPFPALHEPSPTELDSKY
jgi:hypothetical protein